MWEKRRQAAARRRRLIVNDDGAPQYAASNPRAGEGVEGFLSARFQPCVGTQVDSYFWCVADGQDPPFGTRGHPSIGDADAVIIGAARAAGMEIFASLRMNDTHDAFEPKLTYPLKVRRPDLLLGGRNGRIGAAGGGQRKCQSPEAIQEYNCMQLYSWMAFLSIDEARDAVLIDTITQLKPSCRRRTSDPGLFRA